MRMRRTMRALILLITAMAISGLIAVSAQGASDHTTGPPENPNCPEAQGNGCGNGSGNCGSNPGVGSNGQDQGFGNNKDGCGSTPQETDACPGDLNPGNQPAGTTCIVAQTDACPDALNPGNQPAGTVCNVAPPTDACPDDLNPGVQTAGTVCNVASKPDVSDTTAGGDTPDEMEDGTEAHGHAAEEGDDAGSAGVMGSETSATDVSGAAAAAAGGAAAAGELPFTGFEENLLAAIGIALFLAGMALHLSARRTRRRVAGAAA